MYLVGIADKGNMSNEGGGQRETRTIVNVDEDSWFLL